MSHLFDRLPRPQRHGAAAAALGLTVLVLLAGCGDDESGSETGSATDSTVTGRSTFSATIASNVDTTDQRTGNLLGIQTSLLAVLASSDPVAACETYATTKYVRSAFGDLDGCKGAMSSGSAARGVYTSSFKVDGDTATAVAFPKGGALAGEKIEVTLIKDGSLWKVDVVRSDVPVGP